MRLTGDFEGGNPQNRKAITAVGERAYAVSPFSEDEDPVYKFRLDLKIRNESAQSRPTTLFFDWKEEQYNQYRNRIFARFPEKDWVSHIGSVEGSRVVLSLDAPPGETYLTLNPKYDYLDYLDLLERLTDSDILEKQLIHAGESGKQIWMLANRADKGGLRILLTARAHPYETAGSYCIEGFLEELVSNPQASQPLPKFFIIPMLSPEGVCGGLCKLSRMDGEDVARSGNLRDPAIRSLFSLIDTIKPHFILDFHNWMLPNENGLFYETPRWMRRFARAIQRRGHSGHMWRFGARRKFFAQIPSGMKGYAREKFGTRSMTVEYPWFGRTIAQMRKLGADTVAALVELIH